MHALVRGAVAAGVLGALSGWPSRAVRPPAAHDPPVSASSPGSAPSNDKTSAKAASAASRKAPRRKRCPDHQLPDVGREVGVNACVPVPQRTGAIRSARSRRLSEGTSGSPRFRTSPEEQWLPRLPDRPERYESYRLPATPLGPIVPAGAGSVQLDDESAAADDWTKPSPAAIRIETEAEAPIRVAQLEGQTKTPSVRLVGELHGVTVVTEHQLALAAGERTYLVFYGHLARPGPHVVSGAELQEDAIVGYAGDLEGADTPHVRLEVRRLRPHAGTGAQHLSELVQSAVSVPCDPRNVLQLK